MSETPIPETPTVPRRPEADHLYRVVVGRAPGEPKRRHWVRGHGVGFPTSVCKRVGTVLGEDDPSRPDCDDCVGKVYDDLSVALGTIDSVTARRLQAALERVVIERREPVADM